jgi:hypothetical protein
MRMGGRWHWHIPGPVSDTGNSGAATLRSAG